MQVISEGSASRVDQVKGEESRTRKEKVGGTL